MAYRLSSALMFDSRDGEEQGLIIKGENGNYMDRNGDTNILCPCIGRQSGYVDRLTAG